ncbi:hypothetical protein MA16_Dca024902 [Dendrobium catenatum]|uniref:Retrovirus-related Pol polyprotein from transposon TNT 1-94 n=1 Tax=Dendrobium catenatum TaxID=906689 RepID=A0A2I0VI66_9ASPA|nr:hypothetical protein MA16_Dca024902 [Dendrobium catenatum]
MYLHSVMVIQYYFFPTFSVSKKLFSLARSPLCYQGLPRSCSSFSPPWLIKVLPHPIKESQKFLLLEDFIVPNPLKFLISNLKNLVPTLLTNENYSIWLLPLHQHFAANGFSGHLTGFTVLPPASSNDHLLWKLIDHNLISALLSTISPSVLPCFLNLATAHEIWTTLEIRLQPTNSSRFIQLKNELHQIQMKDHTMQQYLAQIKNLVDNIIAAGSTIDIDDIILYILNGLPTIYIPIQNTE